jgi:hypothetical protein
VIYTEQDKGRDDESLTWRETHLKGEVLRLVILNGGLNYLSISRPKKPPQVLFG